MRKHFLRALGLGTLIALLTAAGGYYAYAQSTAPEAARHELAAETASAWLGVMVAPFTEQAATRLNIPFQPGVLAVKVAKDGPAAKAGVQGRDVITAIAGASVATPAALKAEVEKHTTSETVTLSLLRPSGPTQVSVHLEAVPEKQPGAARPHKDSAHPGPGMLPFMPGMMKGGFDNAVGGNFTVIENGQQVTYRVAFGKVASANDTSVTLNLNGGGQGVYSIGSNTKLRGKGSDLKADDKVVAVTKGDSKELATLMMMRERQLQKPEGASRGDHKGRVQELSGFGALGAFPTLEALDRMPVIRDMIEPRMHSATDRFASEWAYLTHLVP